MKTSNIHSIVSQESAGKIAVVIGATGLIGQFLVAKLANSPHFKKVITITRRPVNYESVKVENHVVNFDELSKYAHLFNGDVLFSCLGTTRKQAGSIAAQRVIDLDYQIAAAKLACDNTIAHYALVSSSGANSQSRSAYLRMKGELDDAIKAMPFKRISIFKPSVLLGSREHFRLGETIASVLLPLICRLPGLTRYRPILGKEVAESMLFVSQCTGEGVTEFVLDDVFIDRITELTGD